MSKVEQAVSYFDQDFPCSQSILATYGPDFGLDRDIALRLADGFHGGMVGMGNICGAVIGAIMMIGLKYGRTEATDIEAKMKTIEATRAFIKQFESRNDSIICKDIIGCEIDTPEKAAAARDKGIFNMVCRYVVKDAAEILEGLLQHPNTV